MTCKNIVLSFCGEVKLSWVDKSYFTLALRLFIVNLSDD